MAEVVGTSARASGDACPGALRPHHAADGELLRIRVPGGAISPASLQALAVASAELADGRIGLTSRGNVQVRGVAAGDVPALLVRLRAAGLLSDAEHSEQVRNIVASALSGRRPAALDDVDPLVGALDRALCTRPGLAALSGRFLFAVDDGSGDVAGEGADVVAQAIGRVGAVGHVGAGEYLIRPAGCLTGVRVGAAEVVAAMLTAAEAFLAERTAQGSAAWRIAELADGGAAVLRRLIADGHQAGSLAERAQPPTLEPGLIEQRDGRFAVCAVAGLGLLAGDQTAALVAAAELSDAAEHTALRITPWRRLVLRDLQLPAALAVRELLESVGLVLTPGTAWSRITACAGRPGCAKSLTDVQADAREFAVRCDPIGPAVHWAGCQRGCGTPAGEVVQLLATAGGYLAREARLLSPADAAAAGTLSAWARPSLDAVQ